MKGAVYTDNPHVRLERKAATANIFRNFANEIRRIEACLQAREGHVQQLLQLKYEKRISVNVQGQSEYSFSVVDAQQLLAHP
jgi:hypothetical protein